MKTTKNQKYLNDLRNSAEWRSLRLNVLYLRNNRCELCGSQSNLTVHHKTYSHGIICPPQYLQVLCLKCHKKVHRK